ncbi:homoserine dehydrogenase [Clostridium oceanicum]|uniref:Homoserine dehydrogenase n=1 Tax=Clostridium oceanicum TaxID=1543 RepID=A0ABP3UR58_9CLOT
MISIAILGNGVVGSGVAELIEKNINSIKNKLNKGIKISKILVKNKDKHRNSNNYRIITDKPEDILKEDVDIVVECMGGLNPAYEYIKMSLKQKKHVVTANKDLIAKHGLELLSLAKENNVKLYFEASVGGGIPILRPLKNCLIGNNVTSIKAILNGTTNFILTKMSKENLSFDKALKLAQELGFAEADPTSDIKGYDSARKLNILSNIAYNRNLDWETFKVEGIDKLDEFDILKSNRLGGTVKFIGISNIINDKIHASVRPVIVSKDSILGKVENEFNSIVIEGDSVGELAFYGKGAGKLPTASAVYADIMNVLINKKEDQLLFNKEPANLQKSFTDKKDWIVRIKVDNKDRHKIISKLSEKFNKVYIDTDDLLPKDEVFATIYSVYEKDLEENLRIFTDINNVKTLMIL